MPMHLDRQSNNTLGHCPIVQHGNASWPSVALLYLRDENEERMNKPAACTLPAPAKPLSPNTCSQAHVRSTAEISRHATAHFDQVTCPGSQKYSNPHARYQAIAPAGGSVPEPPLAG